jgi:methyl-accepting chemotaxis protein
MTDNQSPPASGSGDSISEEQFLRAARSFEAIIVTQIQMKDKLGNDLKSSIRVGMVVLGLIATSILILLLTLSAQINRISAVVADMNINFTLIDTQMGQMSSSIDSMVHRVALLELIDQQTGTMDREMNKITADLETMRSVVTSIGSHVYILTGNVESISVSVSQMDDQVHLMSLDMQRMATPARSMEKMFPFQ